MLHWSWPFTATEVLENIRSGIKLDDIVKIVELIDSRKSENIEKYLRLIKFKI